MNNLIYISTVVLFVGCSEQQQAQLKSDDWTDNQKIHLYNDCKDKMSNHESNDEANHFFCECILLQVLNKYSNGEEAIKSISDLEIEEIEKYCTQTISENSVTPFPKKEL